MTRFLGSIISDYLFEEKLAAERTGLETLAVRLAPFLRDGDTQSLAGILREEAEDGNTRLLLTDESGSVKIDTGESMTGRKLNNSYLDHVLIGGMSADSAVIDANGKPVNIGRVLFADLAGEKWQAFCVAAVVWDSSVLGAAVLEADAEAILRTFGQMRDRSVLIFGAIALAALIASFVFAGVLSRPVGELTGGIQHMAGGDFSTRVRVRGNREMRQLAAAFNTMSEKVESLDQSRNQFVSNASHELKTPLATMKIMIESLIYQPDMDKELRTEFLTDIDREIDRLNAIIGDLLTLVRMDSRGEKLKKETLSLAELCHETEHRLMPIAEQKHQHLVLNIKDKGEMVGDRSKLSQVIYNLMENAVKYTQENGIIRVILERNGKNVRLTVSDNGPGIPKADLTHIFDRFYRVDKARSRTVGGTGLGLSIVKQLVALHGGTIRAESEEGEGTAFIVEMPLHQENHA